MLPACLETARPGSPTRLRLGCPCPTLRMCLRISAESAYSKRMNPEITNETGLAKRRTLPEAAKPYCWKRGGPSPNPGGRPKTAHISEALRAVLESGEAEKLAAELLALAKGRKRGSAVQIAALREIADRTEGRAHQTMEVDTNFNSSLAKRLEAARKRVREGKQLREGR